jgi:hypothetical protein
MQRRSAHNKEAFPSTIQKYKSTLEYSAEKTQESKKEFKNLIICRI